MQKNKEEVRVSPLAKTNRIIYISGLALAAVTSVLFVLQHSSRIHLDLTQIIYPCVFHRLSGLYCPGCGGTRAVKALLDGHLVKCFLYHPFVLYCAVLYVLFMVSHTLELLFAKRLPIRGLDFKISYVYIGIILILLQWMAKNLLLLFHP